MFLTEGTCSNNIFNIFFISTSSLRADCLLWWHVWCPEIRAEWEVPWCCCSSGGPAGQIKNAHQPPLCPTPMETALISACSLFMYAGIMGGLYSEGIMSQKADSKTNKNVVFFFYNVFQSVNFRWKDFRAYTQNFLCSNVNWSALRKTEVPVLQLEENVLHLFSDSHLTHYANIFWKKAKDCFE